MYARVHDAAQQGRRSVPTHNRAGKTSALRKALEAFVPMLENASYRPSHITELLGPDLLRYYGYVNFAACGLGGVCLPRTRWLRPLVWRVKCPNDVEVDVRKEDGSVHNNAAAVFVGELMDAGPRS
jgi:hypothetical protein